MQMNPSAEFHLFISCRRTNNPHRFPQPFKIRRFRRTAHMNNRIAQGHTAKKRIGSPQPFTIQMHTPRRPENNRFRQQMPKVAFHQMLCLPNERSRANDRLHRAWRQFGNRGKNILAQPVAGVSVGGIAGILTKPLPKLSQIIAQFIPSQPQQWPKNPHPIHSRIRSDASQPLQTCPTKQP